MPFTKKWYSRFYREDTYQKVFIVFRFSSREKKKIVYSLGRVSTRKSWLPSTAHSFCFRFMNLRASSIGFSTSRIQEVLLQEQCALPLNSLYDGSTKLNAASYYTIRVTSNCCRHRYANIAFETILISNRRGKKLPMNV